MAAKMAELKSSLDVFVLIAWSSVEGSRLAKAASSAFDALKSAYCVLRHPGDSYTAWKYAKFLSRMDYFEAVDFERRISGTGNRLL